MNENNLEYLQEQVKYTGFGENLELPLKEAVELGQEKFALHHEREFGKDSVSVNLNFSKSKQSDMYFFNSYQVNLQKEGNEESINQTFYINKGNNISLREAYNMMDGRSVFKKLTNRDGGEYNAWVELDFKQSEANGNYKLRTFNENYGFDIDKIIEKQPIKELDSSQMKQDLIESLKKGNMALVTYTNGDKEEKRYVAANPQFKTVNFYDIEKREIGNRKKHDQSKGQDPKQGVSNDKNKIGNAQDVLGNTGQEKVNRSRQGTSSQEEAEAPDVPEAPKRRQSRSRSV